MIPQQVISKKNWNPDPRVMMLRWADPNRVNQRPKNPGSRAAAQKVFTPMKEKVPILPSKTKICVDYLIHARPLKGRGRGYSPCEQNP